MIHYILLLIGVLFISYGIRGLIQRKISWRRSADFFDRISGHAGIFDTHTTTEFEGLPAIIVSGAIAIGGLVMLLKGITALG